MDRNNFDILKLKEDLAKFGGDFNGRPIVLMTKGEDGNKCYSLLAGIGLIPSQNVITLISHDVCQDMIDEGKMKMKGELPDDFDDI